MDPRSYKAFLCPWELVRTARQSLVRDELQWRGGGQQGWGKDCSRVLMLDSWVRDTEFRILECLCLLGPLRSEIPTSSQLHRQSERMGAGGQRKHTHLNSRP